LPGQERADRVLLTELETAAGVGERGEGGGERALIVVEPELG